MKNSVIIIAIIIIAVVIIGAYAAMTMMPPATTATANNTTKITANGSKVTVINNNKDVWAHWNLQLQNAPNKNGTKTTYYVQVWIKPGSNATFDLSSILGYGETPLPQDTNITVLGYGGLYNQTANGTSKFDTTFLGWTTNQTIPSPTSNYKGAINAYPVDPVQKIGALPANINDNTVTIGTTSITGTADLLFQQFYILIGPGGIPHFNPRANATLCAVVG